MKRHRAWLYLLILVLIVVFLYLGDWSKLFVLFILIGCVYYGQREQHIYNPFTIFIITCVSYLTYFYQIAPVYFSHLGTVSQILILGCFTGLFFGCVIGKNSFKKSRILGSGTENFWIILLIGLVPAVLSYMIFGNAYTTADMLENKAERTLPIIGQLAYFLPAAIIVACKKNNTKLILISIALSMLAAIMTVTKTALLVTVLFAAIGMEHYRPSILQHKFSKLFMKTAIIWVPVLLIYMFLVNNSVRHEAGGSDMTYIESSGSDINATQDAEGLFLNYLYFCSPWSNVNYNVEHNLTRGYGVNTFGQFARYVGVDVKRVPKMNPYFLNTHSFITDYYLDFGIFGAMIMSLFLGMLLYLCYAKFGCSDDPLLLSFYCVVAYGATMLFFSNHFNDGYIMNYFITFGLCYLVLRQKKSTSRRQNLQTST